MNFNNFTIKAQEAVQEAVNLVQAKGQQSIEPVHLLAGVMKGRWVKTSPTSSSKSWA